MIARELVKPGRPALQEICQYFGRNILQADATLNRALLAEKVFQQPSNRLKLESILHPAICQSVQQQLERITSDYTIIAIPLLTETAQQSQYDRVLLVDCTEQQQIERTQQRDSRSTKQIKAIMNSQATRQQRIDIADDIIENKFDRQLLEFNVGSLHKYYLSLAKSD